MFSLCKGDSPIDDQILMVGWTSSSQLDGGLSGHRHPTSSLRCLVDFPICFTGCGERGRPRTGPAGCVPGEAAPYRAPAGPAHPGTLRRAAQQGQGGALFPPADGITSLSRLHAPCQQHEHQRSDTWFVLRFALPYVLNSNLEVCFFIDVQSLKLLLRNSVINPTTL